eukprot:6058211-Pyramimonas_sp.AAC.1
MLIGYNSLTGRYDGTSFRRHSRNKKAGPRQEEAAPRPHSLLPGTETRTILWIATSASLLPPSRLRRPGIGVRRGAFRVDERQGR